MSQFHTVRNDFVKLFISIIACKEKQSSAQNFMMIKIQSLSLVI